MFDALTIQPNGQPAGTQSRTDLLALGERRLRWLQHRESVLAGNVANADTPNYVARDLAPFKGILNKQMTVSLARTEPGHMQGINDGNTRVQIGPAFGTTSIDGNRVRIEDELQKITITDEEQRLASTLYNLYMSMYRIVLNTNNA
ncbi:MAG: flagellar biosynthesis protein FlgB [Acetobacter sp.]|nr:flagellar biosynthesis protein FlgB [Acetobacter sp.]MBR2124285.1 flagellar biosynthesis protein FlgB [Acetobacter sp.]